MDDILDLFLNETQDVFPVKTCSEDEILIKLHSNGVEEDAILVDWRNGDGDFVQVVTQNVVGESPNRPDGENIESQAYVQENQVDDDAGKEVKALGCTNTELVNDCNQVGEPINGVSNDDIDLFNGESSNGHNYSDVGNENVAENDEHDEVEREKKRKKKCCVVNCNSDEQRVFRFPNVKGLQRTDELIMRFGAWVKGVGDRKLLSKSVGSIFNNYYVCTRHFEDNCFSNDEKTRLEKDAVPTLFECESLSDNDIALFIAVNTADFGSCFDEAEENKLYGIQFEAAMKFLRFYFCDGCNEKLLIRGQDRCRHGKRCIDFQASNDMDPGDVPEELEGLTFIEEQLIALIHPVLSVYKLKGLQFGYAGNVINFSQDVKSFAKKLPHKLADLPSVLLLKYENEKTDVKYFNVRSDKIVKALRWLKANNQFYFDIEICEENVQLLPENGNVYDSLQGTVIEQTVESMMTGEDFCFEENDLVDDEEDIEPDVYQTGVPTSLTCTTEDQVQSTMLDWPEMSSNPIDEYNTAGYIACAFPTLFCKGYADLRSPRPKKINPAAYFQHLLNYKDGRFARHPTFRFFALNSWMRWTACTDGSILIKNFPHLKNVTVSQLKEMLSNDRSLMDRIIYQSSNIRGSKPYWKTRTGELVDMVEQLGLPTIFLTLSCADLHWPDLYRILTGNEDNSHLSEKERRDLLQNNPYIVDSFFHERVECFIETVLSKKFKVVDYWYRVEYQHRGSPHTHGVFWIDGAPDLTNVDPNDEAKLQEIAEFFDKLLITAVNPNLNCECHGPHPCRTLFQDVMNKTKEEIDEDLAQLLVKCQRHTKCSEEYCLKAKRGGLKKCRFKFPFTVRESGLFYFDENGELQYEPARNDPLLNKFQALIMLIWRGNFDISPVLSKKLLLIYLSKYISKSEIRSSSLRELFQAVFSDFGDGDNILRPIRRLYIRTCSDRDYSAQEVCHILSGRNLFTAGGRKFVNVNLKMDNAHTRVIRDNVQSGKTVLEKYETRPERLENESLMNFCKKYDVTNTKCYKKVKENIVRVFPKLTKKSNDDENEMFYRQLVLLHVPWRDVTTFETMNQSWKQLYDFYRIGVADGLHLDPVEVACEEDEEENLESSNVVEDENLEEFMVLARMGPNRTAPPVDIGLRESDLNFNWSEEAKNYTNSMSLNELENFIKVKKAEAKGSSINDSLCNPDAYSLSEDQEAVVDQLHEQLQCIVLDVTRTEIPYITIVQGKAGTGKSHLINCLRWKAHEVLQCQESVMVLGPTGVSALNIRGQTIHSALHLPTQSKDFQDLSGDALKKFSTSMKKVKVLIIDEYSMVGCRMLRQIDLRCRQGKGVNEPFGKLYVYMLGDIRQLPPVCDTALYKTPKEPGLAEQGKALIASVDKVFFLRQCFRQQDPSFQGILDRISTGDITRQDYAVLSKRFTCNVSEHERSQFKDAVRLFGMKKQVVAYNYESLKNLKCDGTGDSAPVAKVIGKHNNTEAVKGTSDQAQGLQHTVYLGKSSQVMLTNNLWTDKGLVNGAKGEIVHIVYEDGEEPPLGMPKVVMCKFNNYSGPGVGAENVVPIPAITKSWTSSGIQCTRTQFPLNLYYACSVHKSQGITEKKAYVDIGDSEFVLGISYVAFSRVKTLDGLLIKPFPYERLSDLKNSKSMKERIEFEAFLEKLSH